MFIKSVTEAPRAYPIEEAAGKDPHDLDIRVKAAVVVSQPGIDMNENITSQSLCTPGCGHTGTFNSYCC